MKLKAALAIVGLNLIGLALLAIPPLPPTLQWITLTWAADPDADGYEIRSSNDVSLSYTNWPIIGFVTGVSNTTFSTLSIAQKKYYVVLASNFWTASTSSNSQPSNITNTPNFMSNGVGNIKITH